MTTKSSTSAPIVGRRSSFELLISPPIIIPSNPSPPGLEFTTKAFVGRVDAAVSLSQEPQRLPEDMEADWSSAGAVPNDGLLALAAKVWGRTDRGTLRAVGVAAAAVGVAAVATMLATCYTSGQYEAVRTKPLDSQQSVSVRAEQRC